MGFRGIDTANQRRHYFEEGVGRGLAAAYHAGVVARADLSPRAPPSDEDVVEVLAATVCARVGRLLARLAQDSSLTFSFGFFISRNSCKHSWHLMRLKKYRAY